MQSVLFSSKRSTYFLKGPLYLHPNTLTMEKLVADFIRIQLVMNEGENKIIAAAAVNIRKKIK